MTRTATRLRAGWTIALLGLLLGGCAGAAGSPGTVSLSVGAGPGSAEDAAEAWDLALEGQPGPPLLITSSPFQQLGDWPDGDHKQGALAGHYTLQDAPTPAAPAHSITLGSGTREVDVVSAAATVELMRRDQGECFDDCVPLTLTDPTLVDLEVATLLGPAVVPAWEFRVAGTEVRLRQVAVDPAEFLVIEDIEFYLPTDWSAEVMSDGEVRITFTAGLPADHPCGNDYTGQAAEFDRVVVVTVDALPNTRYPEVPEECPAAAAVHTVDVPLDHPLADRVLVTSHGLPIGITSRAD
jgi:hypothetical protein